MPVDIDIEHVARLARLDLTEDEKAAMRERLSAILEHAAKVSEVATSDVPPTSSAIALANVFRDDDPEPGISQEAALSNAPEQEGGRFKVVRVVETGQ